MTIPDFIEGNVTDHAGTRLALVNGVALGQIAGLLRYDVGEHSANV